MSAQPGALAAQPATGWEVCDGKTDRGERVDCYDEWARRQREATRPEAPLANEAPPPRAQNVAAASGSTDRKPPPTDPCDHTAPSSLSRFWELEKRTSCGTFDIRGYRPISLSGVAGSSVNREPTSGNPINSATTEQPYKTKETRIQLSVRTKLLQGLLANSDGARDSLWFGYTQQSYWQLFTGAISRPFRSTDHEPEFIYIHPTTLDVTDDWKLRYTGLGVVHQSNGQSLPYSRSWNRIYLLAGAENVKRGLTLQGRVWQRIPEDAATDDNPDISDYIGRAEVTGTWELPNSPHSFALTLRHSLRSLDKGSVRFEWFRKVEGRLVSPQASLRLHTQLFSGYGDSLLDFNRRRTVLGVGLSLVDW